MDNISVKDIADEIGVSESYMISQFKKETGTTPAIYLRDIRLKNAANLLISTEDEIQKICGQVGIQDANYFVKLFKNSYGITPKSYRRQHKI
jgi:AraC-like DNA-binding protein